MPREMLMNATIIVHSIIATVALSAPARAHSWYPKECCNDTDCAPVDSIARFVPTSGGTPQLLITSRHGTAIVPEGYPVRELEGRADACLHASLTDRPIHRHGHRLPLHATQHVDRGPAQNRGLPRTAPLWSHFTTDFRNSLGWVH